ncbi:MAG TPA: hypothetical protein V6C88_15210 [Chroococcidiopsis sp.]
MKHANEETLNTLADLLAEIRLVGGLTEKKRGIFYRKSQAFLHFHDDPTGLFADLRDGKDWQRFPVNTPEERSLLIASLIARLQNP